MQDIHDIRPPVQVGFDPMLLNIILMVTAGIILLALIFFLVRRYLKKRKHPQNILLLPAPLPPYEAAIKALEQLLQREKGDKRLFYFDLTAVLRHYIGRSFQINAIEMTSQEFIKGLNLLDIDKEMKGGMVRFLKQCDPIKYAGIVPDKDMVKEDFLFVKESIQKIETDLTKKDEPEEGEK